VTKSSASSMQLRLVCGLLASAARLVPVPFLDDLLREKALHLMVSRTIKAHGRTYRSSSVAPLYGDERGCLHGCLMFLVLLPIKLILYPFRKILTYVLAAKHLAADLSEAILLGRVLDRSLEDGRLANGSDPAALRAEAEKIRAAFANALAGTDLKLLRGVVTTALRSVSGLPRAAFHAVRKLRKRDVEADPTEGLSSEDRAKVEAGARKVESALETPEVRAYLERFDERFAENLRVLETRGSNTTA
jgi:hypothetical protein